MSEKILIQVHRSAGSFFNIDFICSPSGSMQGALLQLFSVFQHASKQPAILVSTFVGNAQSEQRLSFVKSIRLEVDLGQVCGVLHSAISYLQATCPNANIQQFTDMHFNMGSEWDTVYKVARIFDKQEWAQQVQLITWQHRQLENMEQVCEEIDAAF